MTFEELVAGVGEERYRAACECAWRIPRGDEWPDDLEDVPHDLSDVWYDDQTPLAAQLELALRVYREMPCYGNAMYFKLRHDEFGRDEKRMFWDAWRAALESSDDRLAEPVAYSLWVDFFEDRSTVKEAWREMTRSDTAPSERRLERLLEAAGPVPWRLKEPLFERLSTQPRWHPFIFRALVGSAFDVFGDWEPRAAERWLRRLQLPEDVPDLAALRRHLAG